MTHLSPRAARYMFIAGAFSMLLSLALSLFNVASVMSAPRLTVVGIPGTVGFEGFLSGVSDGGHTLTFRVFDVPSGGTAMWTEALSSVQVTNGLYSVVLGAVTPFASTTFNGDRWIGVTVDGGSEISPRTRVSSVPFALNADNANRIGGGGTANMVALFDGACPSGWTEYTQAQGRYVIGVPSNGLLGATVGSALSDQENRPVGQHSHVIDPPITTSGGGGAHSGHSNSGSPFDGDGAADGDSFRAVAGDHTHTVDIAAFTSANAGGVAGTNAPYIQLRYCRLIP